MWKDIKDWEDYYEVNETGCVRNKQTKKLIVGDINSAGYYRVCLYNKKHNPQKQRAFRHRLVAQAFIDNPNNLPEVNHKDHDLSNNCILNLEWINRKDNELDSRMYGNKQYKPFEVVFNNGNIKRYDTKPTLSEELNVARGLVGMWLRKQSETYKKYNIESIEYI